MIDLKSNYSEGVANEVTAWKNMMGDFSGLFESVNVSEYINNSGSFAPFEYNFISQSFDDNSNILDVGVGTGASSMFLSNLGHNVFALEPTLEFCQLIEEKSAEFLIPITSVYGVAEDLDKLDKKFDIVIFNASLHHCDNPDLALKNCFNLLNPGGKVYLVNENFIKPWQTKKQFQELLISDPIGMGHYGGNEHTYYNWEYINFLKRAGFTDQEFLNPAPKTAVERIESIVIKRLGEERVFSSTTSVLSRFLFYIVEENIRNTKFLSNFLNKTSIFPCNFSALKK